MAEKVGNIDILNQLCHPFSRIWAIEKGKVTQLIYYAYIGIVYVAGMPEMLLALIRPDEPSVYPLSMLLQEDGYYQEAR